MPYRITDYTKKRAKQLGVEIFPSRTKGKKIDVFRGGQKVASVGALGYPDYPTWMKLEAQGKVPKGFAEMRRKNYKSRHQKNRLKKGSAGYYADQLLW
jgi:hypothetical protein